MERDIHRLKVERVALRWAERSQTRKLTAWEEWLDTLPMIEGYLAFIARFRFPMRAAIRSRVIHRRLSSIDNLLELDRQPTHRP